MDLLRVKGKTKPVAIYEGLDHHTRETFLEMEKALSAFQKGLSLYKRRDWKGASGRFEEALAANEHDIPSEIYLKRCRHYLDEPPAEDWDGVWVMKEK